MDVTQIPNMAQPITIPETFVVKNEVEEALPSDHEQFFDFPNHLLSPKMEGVPVGTFCRFSRQCKLEPDTHELGSTCFDNEEAVDTSIETGTIRETYISTLSPEHQRLPVGIASRISNLISELGPQNLDNNGEEIIHSTACSSDGMDQPKLFGLKPIMKVKKLTEKAIEELPAGIWRCSSCAKAEKLFFMLDLHIDTGCGKLSPIECNICPAIFKDYRNFVAQIMEHQMGETRRCPICLRDVSQQLVIHGHFSPGASELELPGSTSLAVTQNPSKIVCISSFELDSEAKTLDNNKIYLNSSLHNKEQRILERLKETHTKIKKYICDVCDKSFSHGYNLKVHQRVHTGEKPFNCDVCEKTFSQSNSLIYHQRIHTGEKPFKCDICDKFFSLSSNLIKHQKVHAGKKPFISDVCEKTFSQSSSSIYHQRTHSGEKPFKCDICEKTFTVSSNLIKHQRIHTGEKPFKCDVCEKTFSQSSNLIEHLKVHTGEKPFKCDICEKTFSRSSILIEHLKVHTGEKPFKCDVCEKTFSHSSSLIYHQRTHSGEKPFKCDICEKTFSVSSNLIKHQRVHTRVKPFKCDICKIGYSSKLNLNNHIKTHSQK